MGKLPERSRDDSTESDDGALGVYLRGLREALGLTLREVEARTGGAVSNAYLSQVERGHVKKPSVDVLHSLSEVYNVSYADLMRRAGYVVPKFRRRDSEQHGQAITAALGSLTTEEEEALLAYLKFYRQQNS